MRRYSNKQHKLESRPRGKQRHNRGNLKQEAEGDAGVPEKVHDLMVARENVSSRQRTGTEGCCFHWK